MLRYSARGEVITRRGNASEDVALGLVAQGLEWIQHGRLVSRHGLLDYSETLHRANAPLCVIEERDKMALSALTAWTESRAEAVELESGQGGLAALLGEDSTDAALKPLLRWLERQRAGCWPSSSSAVPLLATG